MCMIKVFSAEQFRAWDAHTIQQEPIASLDLMERACRAFTDWFIQVFPGHHKIAVVCGTGNNGGDGIGIARMLHEHGYRMSVFIQKGKTESLDYLANRKRLPVAAIELNYPLAPTVFDGYSVIIDALFGTGLSRPLEGNDVLLVNLINQSKAIRVAVDVPSGLLTDRATHGTTVHAHYTATFQAPKLAFLLPGSAHLVGQWTTLDIGLQEDYRKLQDTPYQIPTLKTIRKRVRPRNRFDHKGTFGHALLIAGSTGKAGAAVLAARAALRAGVGLATVHTSESGRVIVQTAVPEAMVSYEAQQDYIATVPALERYDAIGIGPGLGQHASTKNALSQILENARQPLVLDADALNIMSDHTEMIARVPKGTILTPHPKELERLVGSWKDDFERLEKQKTLALQLQSIVINKGAWSAIALPNGRVYFNPTGNPGMATGGSGDVLTGILTALLAQGYPPEDAALVGCYVHGLAGDLGAREKTEMGLIAGDLPDFLAAALKRLA